MHCAHYCGVWAIVNPIAGGVCEAVCGNCICSWMLCRLILFQLLIDVASEPLNNPKTCRMVGLIAHAMPTFVCKFS
ncbi:putative immunity/bacteriocin fusion bifunctional protein [Staphylococcus aureus]|uniref:putative immunity/bacteriocin fusion bifunctional protein n=1 Tax=Staphylococcus aureus TaxID=1280 RepID=UPI001EF7A2F7|nr:putative immunity/bacteriocin fusion bifunctional protein [Staphylococcus aureus]